jgi:hypothetical protein
MRNRAVPLLVAVLAVGTLAAGGAIVTTAEPALAVCGQTGPCPGPSPTIKPPPPPTVVFSTGGLTERDVTLTPGSSSPGIIQIGAKEGFTITATTQVAGATVALAGEDKFTCQAPNSGVTVSYDYVYVPHFTASPKSFDFQPFSCNPGYLLTTGTYRMYAEAEDSSGTVIGTTRAQTYQFTPEITLNNVVVPESSYGVDTGLILLPGDTVTFSASGQIWAGVLLTGTNGPQGWVDYAANCDPKFPLVCAPPYGLIGYLDNDGGYFYIGAGGGAAQPPVPTLASWGVDGRIGNYIDWPSPPLDLLAAPTHLMLRTNDDTPGNGSGAFSVNIQIARDGQF